MELTPVNSTQPPVQKEMTDEELEAIMMAALNEMAVTDVKPRETVTEEKTATTIPTPDDPSNAMKAMLEQMGIPSELIDEALKQMEAMGGGGLDMVAMGLQTIVGMYGESIEKCRQMMQQGQSSEMIIPCSQLMNLPGMKLSSSSDDRFLIIKDQMKLAEFMGTFQMELMSQDHEIKEMDEMEFLMGIMKTLPEVLQSRGAAQIVSKDVGERKLSELNQLKLDAEPLEGNVIILKQLGIEEGELFIIMARDPKLEEEVTLAELGACHLDKRFFTPLVECTKHMQSQVERLYSSSLTRAAFTKEAVGECATILRAKLGPLYELFCAKRNECLANQYKARMEQK